MLLKRRLRRLVANVSYYSGIAWIWQRTITRSGVRILAYHAVEKVPSNSFSVSIKNFEAHMAAVKERCHVLTLGELATHLNAGSPLPRNSLVVTFDDGFKNFQDNAVPILERLGIPATCFVISSRLDDESGEFLSREDLSDLTSSRLVSIGSHSVSHVPMAGLSQATLENELGKSKEELSDATGETVDLFCFPYGTLRDFDEISVQGLADAGYQIGCTSINGVNSLSTNPLKLRRTKIEWGDDPATFRKMLESALDIWVIVDYLTGFMKRKRELNLSKAPMP